MAKLVAVAKQEERLNGHNDNLPAGELLIGAPAIASFLGLPSRRIYRLADDGKIPTFKLGGSLTARRSTLRTWMADLETAARAAA